VTVCSTVDDCVLSETMMSVYETVVVAVDKITSTDGVLQKSQHSIVSISDRQHEV
jgi:hypothetical protein